MNAIHECEQDSTLVKNEAKRAFLGAENKSSINRIMSAYTVSQFSYAVSRAHGILVVAGLCPLDLSPRGVHSVILVLLDNEHR